MSAPAVFRERRHAWAVHDTVDGRLVGARAPADPSIKTALFRTKAEAARAAQRAPVNGLRVVKVTIKYEALS
jgi:hypothetical protein